MARTARTAKPRVRTAPASPPVVQDDKETTGGVRPADLVGDPSTQHPELTDVLPLYREIRDARDGARRVKARNEEYLPKPSGFAAQTDGGASMYEAYKKRAQFPEILDPTILGMVGIIHRVEAQIEGLEENDPVWEKATPDDLPLEMLHRRITEELLTTARVGLFADLPPDGGDDPRISIYRAESIVNWSDEGDFYVLEENYRVRNGFSWSDAKRYRVLRKEDDGVYRVYVIHRNDPASKDVMYEPFAVGRRRLDEIPFQVAGAIDLSVTPERPPLVGVADASYAIYRLDADYRHQLFMSGQETLFVYGVDEDDAPEYVGAGVVVTLPVDGQAEYVGPSGIGISSHRTAIADERENAAQAGMRVFDSGKRGAESGEALRIRARAGTATLVSIAISSAMVLEKALRHRARLRGQQNVDSIIVKPNLDFIDSPLTATEAKALMELWTGGAISYGTLYENMQRGGIASFERTAEDELDAVLEEEASREPGEEDESAALGVGETEVETTEVEEIEETAS